MNMYQMAPKKKKSGKKSAPKKVGEGKNAEQDRAREALLHIEYEKLRDMWNNLKNRKEWLICENQSLQREVDQTRLESQEYIAYQSKRHQRLQSLMGSSTDQPGHMDLKRQGEELQGRTNELMKQLTEKETELVHLDAELRALSQYKGAEQQCVSRLGELRAERPGLQRHHRDVLRGLQAHLLSERERSEGRARQAFHTAVLTASREVLLSQQSHNKQVLEENERLIAELQQLIEKARLLRDRQGHLRTTRDPLLLEREYTSALMRRRDP
ncbi:uncharacterized protein ccdc166 isoform X1 [Gadus morhua]|nr:uncharacterized protein LOC115529477 isoform X1 [Gadus morhua]